MGDAELNELINFKKQTLKYFYYLKKTNLTLKQKEFISNYKQHIKELLKEKS